VRSPQAESGASPDKGGTRHLKKSDSVLRAGIRVRYAFIESHRTEFRIVPMCRILRVARSGYYEWIYRPKSARERDNERLLKLVKASHSASGGIYGAPRVLDDLRESGERCGLNRVARLMRQNKLRGCMGFRRPRYKSGRPSHLAPNRLQRQFTTTEPNKVWVTDISYIRTGQGWLYLAVVIDLFSRQVVGWSMKPSLESRIVLDALLMAVWRRKPAEEVLLHSDQGTQYGSGSWLRFCKANRLLPSMSRRGNCHDNAVAESFFSSLKKER
jgi:putative transposase